MKRRFGPWRALAMSAGLAVAALALYLLYFNRWLGATSPLDPWFDGKGCLVAWLCRFVPGLGHHLGLLAALCAILLFALAMIGSRVPWREGLGELVAGEPPARPPLLVVLVAACGAVSLGSIVHQAVTAGIRSEAPSLVVWLVGLGAGVLATSLWDLPAGDTLAELLSRLSIAGGMGLLLLAGGALVAGRLLSLLIVAPGLGLIIAGLRGIRRKTGVDESGDVWLALGLALLCLGLGLIRVWYWRYAFVGDEWEFFERARLLVHRPEARGLFEVADGNQYHTWFSSALQAIVMRIVGENIYGWRLSSLLPMVLSVPAIYAFGRWLGGRTTAIVAAGLLGCSHLLVSFSMVPYNSTQALLPLTFGLALFALAERRESGLAYFLLGAAVGSSFLVFALARLAVIPVGVLVAFFLWTSRRRFVASTVGIVWGGLAAAAPLLFNTDNWRGLLKATPVQSEVAFGVAALASQMMRNVAAGAQVFLASNHNTHHVVGPHVDPLTALLILAGLGATMAGFRNRRGAAWLLASLLFWAAVSGIQQYGWVATTRMFILAPIYAVYGGVGAAAITAWVTRRGVRTAGALACVVLCVGLNQLHIVRISHPNSTTEPRELLVREFQSTAAEDGGGVPIYTIWRHPHPILESMILRAHDVPRERIRLVAWEELRAIPDFCEVEDPRAVLLHVEHPEFDEIHSHMQGCWPGGEEPALRNHVGEARLYRWANPAAQEEFARPGSERHSGRSRPDTLPVPSPVDAVVDHRGNLFVLSVRPPSVWRFTGDLRRNGSFPLIQSRPTALGVTPGGVLVVGSEGDHPQLVWYDAAGAVVRRLAKGAEVSTPRGISVAADGTIWLADPGYNRVSRLSPDGHLTGKFTAGGRMAQPASVTSTDDGGVWALSTGPAEWLRLTANDEVVGVLPTEHMNPVDAARMVVLADGSLLTAEPRMRRLVRRTADWGLLDLCSGFDRPLSFTIDGNGRIFLVERKLEHVAVLPPL